MCYAKSWHGGPLAGWSGNPILCLGGTRLSLTTGSGRSQPGWRRPRPLRHHRAGSGRTRKGSSPPRHTVRREMSKAAWGEKLPLSGSLLGLVKVLVSLPNSDQFFCYCFIFCNESRTGASACLPVSLTLSAACNLFFFFPPELGIGYWASYTRQAPYH